MVARIGWTALAIVLYLAPVPVAAQTSTQLRAAASREGAMLVRRSTRPPVKLRVTPRRQLARDCAVRYVEEWRPSGPVIVPHMRCWWVWN